MSSSSPLPNSTPTPTPTPMPTSTLTTQANTSAILPRRKIGSRACDACKIRKVRCSEVPPCTRCASIGIECTFNKRQATRGPRSLRAKTLAEIRSIQGNQHTAPSFSVGGGDSNDNNDSPPPSAAATFCETDSTGGGKSGSSPSGLSSDHQQSASPPTSTRKNQHQHQRHQQQQQQQQQQQHSSRTPVSSLIVRLCIFRLRLYPVWPILDAEAVIASLLRDPTEIDLETYALANAVCAAIIAQLKLPFEGRTDDNDPATAASMAAECQRTKAALLQGDSDGSGSEKGDVMKNLNMLRISFFQHIYHENMSPGGSKSLLFLREAITVAQIMGLHRKGLYQSLSMEESQMRRRIIWLLFVTERGVAMLHKLPTILVWQPNRFPPLDDSWINTNVNNGHQNNNTAEKQDEAHILPAFKKLVNLFWVFDQGGAFDIILNGDDDADPDADSQRSNSRLEYLQRRLQEMSWSEELESNEVQQADILVTKSWMQAVLWRASVRRHNHHHAYRPVGGLSPGRNTAAVIGVAAAGSPHYQQTTIAAGPYRIVNDFLSHISHYSKTALEAHGPTIELKIFEIASALTDALAANLDFLHSSTRGSMDNDPSGTTGVDMNIRPVDMLVQLQRLLASSRGGNKPLLTMLCARIAEVENGGGGGPSSPPNRGLGRDMANDNGSSRDNDGHADADTFIFGMGYSNGERRMPNSPGMPAASSYVDIVRLDYPSQLPPMWPGMRSDPSTNNFNVDPGGNLGITFAQMTNESWNGWALDLSGMSQISML